MDLSKMQLPKLLAYKTVLQTTNANFRIQTKQNKTGPSSMMPAVANSWKASVWMSVQAYV